MEEWVAHVDESGHEPGVRGEPVRFVLACVAASPKTTAKIGEKIRRFKLELAPHLDPADWELHAGDMFHNRIGSPLGSMTTDEKMATMRRIVDIVCDSDAVTFIVTVTGVRARGKGGRNTRIVEHATTLPVGRLERFAQDRGRMTLRVISDNAPEGQRLAMERATGRRASGPMSRRGTQAVTGIEFADSRSSAMLQAADAMAYIVNRDARGDPRFGSLLGDIGSKAWRPASPAETGSGRRTGQPGTAAPKEAPYVDLP